MLSAPALDFESVKTHPGEPSQPEMRRMEPDVEAEAVDFITRHILERDADFFDG